jgi:PAS domain S-box-containing protein
MLKTILAVDDNPANLKLIEKQLKSQGYLVIPTHNGAEALEAARQTRPDLIVSDILMPVMDGFTLCRNWKADPQLMSIPFIFYTATYTDPRDEQFALSLGASRFIIKPAEPEVFLKAIETVLEGIRERPSNDPDLTPQPEEVILTRYNEVLVHKLEQKVQEMQEINQSLEKEIAQRKSVERSLRQTEETLRRVFSSIAGGIVITDLEGVIIDCNNNAVTMALKRSKSELVGKNVLAFLAGAEKNKAIETIRQINQEGISASHQYFVYRDDGSVLPIEVSSGAAKDEAGNPLFLVISFANITQRKEMEKQILELYEQEKKQREELQEEANARGLFIEVLAHELRTPLTPILASAGMLAEKMENSPGTLEYKLSTNIFAGTQTLVSRLEELLDLATYSRRTFKLELSDFSIEELIREVIREVGQTLASREQTFILDIGQDLPVIKADKNRLKMVLTTLCSNAVKFSPPGSEIRISGELQNQELRVEVSDQGAGISEEEIERLFKPYHRVEQDRQKFPGIGLGLAICRQIMEAHQGRISVSSQSSGGSTFYLALPLNTVNSSN